MANVDIYDATAGGSQGWAKYEPVVSSGGSGAGASPRVGALGGASVTNYFKMVALKSPGPGEWVWVATGAADYAGASAPGAIQAGSAEVVSRWSI